jgi:hypothetical protein
MENQGKKSGVGQLKLPSSKKDQAFEQLFKGWQRL